MIALDLDRTAVSGYDHLPLTVNPALLVALLQRNVRCVTFGTNQGGLPWFIAGIPRADGRLYPSPEQFVGRLQFAVSSLAQCGIEVAAVRVCVFHPRAEDRHIQTAAHQVRDLLAGSRFGWRVYTTAAARKPSPLMLRSVGATEYWGDSNEDEGAAIAAGIPFVRVARFY